RCQCCPGYHAQRPAACCPPSAAARVHVTTSVAASLTAFVGPPSGRGATPSPWFHALPRGRSPGHERASVGALATGGPPTWASAGPCLAGGRAVASSRGPPRTIDRNV